MLLYRKKTRTKLFYFTGCQCSTRFGMIIGWRRRSSFYQCWFVLMSAKCYPPMYSALRKEKRRATALPTEWTINPIQWKTPKGTILTRHRYPLLQCVFVWEVARKCATSLRLIKTYITSTSINFKIKLAESASTQRRILYYNIFLLLLVLWIQEQLLYNFAVTTT